MKSKLFFFLILAAVVGLAACSSDDDKILQIPESVEIDGYGNDVTVNMPESGWNLEWVEMDGVRFPLESNGEKESVSFLTISPQPGKLTFSAYPSYYCKRTFTLAVNVNGTVKSIKGLQALAQIVCDPDADPDAEVLCGDTTDDIQPSPQYPVFNADEQDLTISTLGYWWIVNFNFGTNFKDGNLLSHTISLWSNKDPKVYKETFDWLTIEADGTDIKLHLEANLTGKTRTFFITIGQGDFYIDIIGYQSPLK